MNFRQIDLNLLRVLVAIHRTRSVTEAGKLLALSQSATSSALARLRHHLGDELFVRTAQGLAPTHACELLAPEVTELLSRLESALSAGQRFDPVHAEARWRLSLSDLGEMMFLPPLAATLREKAPLSRLANVSVAAEDLPAALEAREIDFAIGILNPRHRSVSADLLFTERYVGLTSADWKPEGSRGGGQRLTLPQMARASMVVPSPTATFHGSVEKMLWRLKLQDRIVLRARHFGALPELVLNTDLMTIVPLMYAQKLRRLQKVRVWELPREATPEYEVRLVWHTSTARDPAQVWIRDQVRRLFEAG